MEECIFCKIVNGELDSHKIHEDEKHFVFLDIYPPTFNGKITMPVFLVITKEHLKSNIFEDLDNKQYLNLLVYTRKIAKAVQKAINPARVCLVFEGMEINHIHAKLYAIFNETYPNYLSTKKSEDNNGIRADGKFLREIVEKVKIFLK